MVCRSHGQPEGAGAYVSRADAGGVGIEHGHMEGLPLDGSGGRPLPSRGPCSNPPSLSRLGQSHGHEGREGRACLTPDRATTGTLGKEGTHGLGHPTACPTPGHTIRAWHPLAPLGLPGPAVLRAHGPAGSPRPRFSFILAPPEVPGTPAGFLEHKSRSGELAQARPTTPAGRSRPSGHPGRERA